jgi:hypothetical protein
VLKASVVNDPTATFATADHCIAKRSFDHLVGGHRQSLRHGEVESLCSFEVNDQLESCRQGSSKVGGFGNCPRWGVRSA